VQMRAWLDHTVARILKRHPKRVLAIGCGNGLILSRLLPECEVVWGTDFSAAVLRTAEARLRAHPRSRASFTLQRRNANDFSGLPLGHFDAVVLNSVVQYFPGVDYLLDVIRAAADVLAPGGFVYLGDLRSLPLLNAFHASVELQAAAADLPIDRLRERVNSRVRQEQELVLDPRLFDELPTMIPRFGWGLVELKRGTDDNELTKFRYDVTLLSGGEEGVDPDVSPMAWQPSASSVAQVETVLRRERPGCLSIRGIPNARVRYETALAALLAESRDTDLRTADELRAAARANATDGVDPELFHRCGSEIGYDVEVHWSESSIDSFDVRFRRSAADQLGIPGRAHGAAARQPAQQFEAVRKYGNDPLSGRLERIWLPDIRRFLEQRLPDYMVPATFVPLRDLPRNGSGKVDRAALPAPDGVRPDLKHGYCVPRTAQERALANIWAAVLGVERVGIHDNFFELGGDSILSIQIIARASGIGLALTPKDLFQNQTIAEICKVVKSTLCVQDQQGPVTGPTLPSPIQRWFFELDLAEPAHFNQAVEMDAAGLDEATLQRALECLLAHHDALRTRFVRGESGWIQTVDAPDSDIPFQCEELSGVPGAGRAVALQASTLRWQRSLSLDNGPLVRLVLFRNAGAADRLLWIIHHLVVDGVSWRILLEDMKTVYEQIREGQEPRLPHKTTSFQAWADRLHEYAQSPQLLAELPHWLEQANDPCPPLPHDQVLGPNDVASTYSIASTLGDEDTRTLLNVLPERQRVRIHEVLIAALAQSLARWTSSRHVLLDLEGHGRDCPFDGVDVSRTVGWFTALYPVVLEVGEAQEPGEVLFSIKEQLRRVPNGGIGYGMLRYLRCDAESVERLACQPQAEVAFNYLGQFPGVGTPIAAEPARDLTRSENAVRRHAIEVNASVAGGRLCTHWTFSANIHTRASAQRLVGEYGSAVARLIAHGTSNAPARYAPSDFGQARVSQNDLDRLLAKFRARPAT